MPTDPTAELDAFIDSIPKDHWRWNETIASGGPATPLIAAWLHALDPERAAALRQGLEARLRGDDRRQANHVIELAEVWRDEELVNVMVREARQRFEDEANGQAYEKNLYLNRRLASLLGDFPVPAGVARLRELAAHLPSATRPEERSIRAWAAIALCYIEKRPVSCLEPIFAIARAWGDPPLANDSLRFAGSLFVSRRGEGRALAALLRPEGGAPGLRPGGRAGPVGRSPGSAPIAPADLVGIGIVRGTFGVINGRARSEAT